MMHRIFQNKRNPHKFIEVKRYNDGHYVWKQFIENTVTHTRTYTGCSLKRSKLGKWNRVNSDTLAEVIASDYVFVLEEMED